MKIFSQFAGLIVLGALPVFVSGVSGQAAPAAPRLQYAGQTHDFGKVKPTDALTHDFLFTNTGNAVLELTDVQPGCGCTTMGAWDRKVEPGRTGRIPIQFNPGSFSGAVSKPITVTCNDPAQRTSYLQVQATVWRPVDIQPQYLSFIRIEGETTNETKTARIVSNVETPLTLETPRVLNPAFHAELKTVRPGQEFELRVTYAGPPTNGVVSGNILIANSAEPDRQLSVTAFMMPQPALAAQPPQLLLPAGPLPTENRLVVALRNNTSQPVKLSDPTINAEGASVRMQELELGKTFRFDLVFPAQFQARAGGAMELSVKTSHPKYPVMKVPVTQAQPPVVK